MNEPLIRVVIHCPRCEKEQVCDLSTATAAVALLEGSPLPLRCRCQAQWNATEIERAQIRDYLAASSL